MKNKTRNQQKRKYKKKIPARLSLDNPWSSFWTKGNKKSKVFPKVILCRHATKKLSQSLFILFDWKHILEKCEKNVEMAKETFFVEIGLGKLTNTRFILYHYGAGFY